MQTLNRHTHRQICYQIPRCARTVQKKFESGPNKLTSNNNLVKENTIFERLSSGMACRIIWWNFTDVSEVFGTYNDLWWKQRVPPKRQYTSTRLNCATTQKTAIFVVSDTISSYFGGVKICEVARSGGLSAFFKLCQTAAGKLWDSS
jgi:hypothetical protein